MLFQGEKIREFLNKASAQPFFQGHLGKPLNIQSISTGKKSKLLNPLCRTMGICAVEHLGFPILHNLGFTLTGRTVLGNLQIPGLGFVFPDLGDNHICLINRDFISDAKGQVLAIGDIVQAGSADHGALQLHRRKNRHRINQACSAGRPFHGK